MKTSFLRSGVLCIAILASMQATAAEITPIKLDSGATALVVTGEIKPGDGAKFRSEASKYKEGFVLLESQGGSLVEAIDIGETIRLKGYATGVFNGSECNSSCALIWLAGSPRGLSRSARIGFHAAYTDSSGEVQESGVANAMVGRYLTLLNLPEKAVIFATTAPPSQLNWLTTSNFATAGVDLRVMDDLDLGPPQSKSAKVGTPRPVNPPPLVRMEAPPPPIQTVTAPKNSETSVWRSLQTWSVYVDHTLQDSCFLLQAFNNQTSFRVGVDRENGGYYAMLMNPAWRSLEVGKGYPVQFQFDDRPIWNAPTIAEKLGESTILYVTFKDPNFWNEFSHSNELRVTRDGKPVTKMLLSGSKPAFDELVVCQRSEDAQARSRDPFAQ